MHSCKTYLYCIPVQSSGHGSCIFHFQHQSLHGKNSRGGIALTPNSFARSFVRSIQYRKYIVHFDRYRDQNIFYHSNLLKSCSLWLSLTLIRLSVESYNILWFIANKMVWFNNSWLLQKNHDSIQINFSAFNLLLLW